MPRIIRLAIIVALVFTITLDSASVVNAAKTLELDEGAQDVQYVQKGCGVASTSNATGNTSVDCGVDADGDKGNMDKIWDFLVGKFREQGYSSDEAEKAASGVMGNMWQETGGSFNPHIDHGMGCNSGPAIGLNQWCFSRQDNLKAKGVESGKPEGWRCLGVQLDFLWGEMETTHSHLFELMKGKSPRDAAEIFDHGGDGASSGVSGFEESWDSQQGEHHRAGYADDVYGMYAQGGSGAPTSGDTLSSGSGQSNASSTECAGAPAGGGPVPADCAGLVAEVNKMEREGKLIMPQKSNQDQDLANCTEEAVYCDPGIKLKFLKAFVTIIKAVDGNVTLWNMNTGHPCDELNHPHGRAVDIPCSSGLTSIEVCKKIIDYSIDHKEELELTEIIWQQNYRCDSGVDCNVDGHHDHIHLGVGGA